MAEETKLVFMMPGADPDFDALAEGETVEKMVTIRKEPGGKACLTEVEGVALEGYADDAESDEETDLLEMMNEEA